ncbi:MAG: ABC transporter ATP-binding protein [Candidatus Brockarchaeota archaeon]|nr:ABC transporter ATP-binding protein [Candidatus Brockarchaeota archaeon]
MPRVEVVGLSKTYGPIKALDDVNLTIEDREYVSILGPSGCGKTTLIKCIAGIIEPTRGEVYIGGRAVRGLMPEDRDVGYVFQEIALFPHMNVWNNVTYGPRVKGWPADRTRSLALEMLDMIGLEDRSNSYPDELSGGAGQKTAVARAVSSGSTLLLLDEPLGALDAKVRADLRYRLRDLVKELNLTAIHVTHDQEEAMSISDRVVVMRAGRIVEEGNPMRLYLRPKNVFTANFLGEANFLQGKVVEVGKEGAVVEVGGCKLRTRDASRKLGEEVVACVRPEFVSIRRPAGKPALRGVIRDVAFKGGVVRYELSISGASVFSDCAAGLEPEGLQRGDEVEVEVDCENVLVFQPPPEGLDRAVSLE